MPAKQNKHMLISFTSKPAPGEPSKPLTAHEKALQVRRHAQALSTSPLFCHAGHGPFTLCTSVGLCTAADILDKVAQCTA